MWKWITEILQQVDFIFIMTLLAGTSPPINNNNNKKSTQLHFSFDSLFHTDKYKLKPTVAIALNFAATEWSRPNYLLATIIKKKIAFQNTTFE